METNFKKSSAIKKPKNDYLRNKTLSRNLRSSIDRRYSTREIPPLTPLHRLKRFKAIRDKNLKNKKEPAEKRSITKMDTVTTVEINEAVKQKETPSHVLKANIPENYEEPINDDGVAEDEKDLANGRNESELNGKDYGDLTGENIVTHSNDKNKLLKNDNSPTVRVDEGLSSDVCSTSSKDIPINVEIQKSSEENDIDSNDVGSIEKITEGEEGNKISGSPQGPSQEKNDSSQDQMKKEGSVESDVASVSSSSTFPSDNKFLASSSDDFSDATRMKGENSEEEEIDVDRVSTKSNDSIQVQESEKKDVTQDETLVKGIKQSDIPSKIPRSVFNSGSSYKTAYGSLSRISGRRAVGVAYKTSSRKRKAEDDLEPTANGKRLSSPSQPSPRWKFFRPSISNLWSPRKTPYDLSVTSTPLKSFDDSMAVNIDEETIHCHLNDSDLFFGADKTPSKRSRWGCNIM